MVPTESIVSYSCFFSTCKESGIDFDGLVVFVDRSNARYIGEAHGITLKYCSRHIMRISATT